MSFFANEKKQALLVQYYNDLYKRYYVTDKNDFFCLFI